MKDLQTEVEWDFIISEVHINRPTESNKLKRELLFLLQSILGSADNEFTINIYLQTKEKYLSL